MWCERTKINQRNKRIQLKKKSNDTIEWKSKIHAFIHGAYPSVKCKIICQKCRIQCDLKFFRKFCNVIRFAFSISISDDLCLSRFVFRLFFFYISCKDNYWYGHHRGITNEKKNTIETNKNRKGRWGSRAEDFVTLTVTGTGTVHVIVTLTVRNSFVSTCTNRNFRVRECQS